MQPDLILIPFGKNATAGTIESIPNTAGPGDGPQKATWNYGFPQVTMTPLAAGGIPPQGQDVNGVLNAISEHTVFLGGGGQYKWSAEYVAENGGYSIGDVIQADDGLNSYVSLVNTNTANFNTTPASIGVSWGLYAGRKTQTQATETVSGIAEIATTAEVTAGTDDSRTVTPLKLQQRLSAVVVAATETVSGIAEIATQAEVTTGADDARIVTPAKLRGAQATQVEAETGADNTKLMTPLRTKQLIDTLAGRLLATQVITASGTYTPTPGMKRCRVRGAGGGGGTGGSAATAAGTYTVTGGGAYGGYSEGWFTAAQIGASIAVVIGSAGTAGASTPTNGGSGGATSIGALMNIPGGGGGIAVAATPNASPALSIGGSPGAVPTGGSIVNMAGNPGDYGLGTTTGGLAVSGRGGSGPLGAGGFSTSLSVAASGSGFGAGGSGAVTPSSFAARTGAAGTAGVLIIEEFA